jgi:hypothetical protein
MWSQFSFLFSDVRTVGRERAPLADEEITELIDFWVANTSRKKLGTEKYCGHSKIVLTNTHFRTGSNVLSLGLYLYQSLWDQVR